MPKPYRRPTHHRTGRPPQRDRRPEPPHAEDHDAIRDLWELLLPDPPPRGTQQLGFLPCEQGQPLPKVLVIVDDVPADPPAQEVAEMCDGIAHVGAHLDDGGVLLAIVRHGSADVTEADVRWLEPLAAACRERGVALLGLWLRVVGRPPLRLDAPRGVAVA
ncbi:MAG TPA: hypothetical protein VHE83_08520 [Mycobacteriales bacterium]|nr:hypothetical protein [Mycobacteriales bacterium]